MTDTLSNDNPPPDEPPANVPTPQRADADGLEAVETELPPEDEDGLRHVRIDIRRALPNRRLDKYLSGRLGKATSRTALQRYIREGHVTVDGKVVKPSYVIRTADVIDMLLPVVRPQEIPPRAHPAGHRLRRRRRARAEQTGRPDRPPGPGELDGDVGQRPGVLLPQELA